MRAALSCADLMVWLDQGAADDESHGHADDSGDDDRRKDDERFHLRFLPSGGVTAPEALVSSVRATRHRRSLGLGTGKALTTLLPTSAGVAARPEAALGSASGYPRSLQRRPGTGSRSARDPAGGTAVPEPGPEGLHRPGRHALEAGAEWRRSGASHPARVRGYASGSSRCHRPPILPPPSHSVPRARPTRPSTASPSRRGPSRRPSRSSARSPGVSSRRARSTSRRATTRTPTSPRTRRSCGPPSASRATRSTATGRRSGGWTSAGEIVGVPQP